MWTDNTGILKSVKNLCFVCRYMCVHECVCVCIYMYNVLETIWEKVKLKIILMQKLKSTCSVFIIHILLEYFEYFFSYSKYCLTFHMLYNFTGIHWHSSIILQVVQTNYVIIMYDFSSKTKYHHYSLGKRFTLWVKRY